MPGTALYNKLQKLLYGHDVKICPVFSIVLNKVNCIASTTISVQALSLESYRQDLLLTLSLPLILSFSLSIIVLIKALHYYLSILEFR